MKSFKNLFLALFLLALPLFAQTTAGYFTESIVTAGASLNPSQKGYTYATTSAVGAGDTTQYIASQAIGLISATATARNGFMGSKIMVGFNISVAFADVVSTVTLEGSGDGTNWATLATLSSDATPNVTGVRWYLADLSSTYVPYVRIKFNANTLQINKTGRVAFLYAIPR